MLCGNHTHIVILSEHMRKHDGTHKATVRAREVDVLKAWAVYYLLKCAVVLLAMYIGERLGFFVISFEKGPALQEGVKMAWVALAAYYTTLAVIATFLFKWIVHRFVVSRMAREVPIHLSLFLYCRAWLIYATMTYALGYLIALALEHTILELLLRSLADAPWVGWLHKSVRPIAFTAVSLVVFRCTVIRLLLADRTAPHSPKAK